MTRWDADERKDLLVGLSNGQLKIYLNVATDEGPAFDGGTLLQVGEPGSKVNIDVGSRACPTVVDWNSDGKKDIVAGALDGKIHVFLNEGTDTLPDFRVQVLAQNDGGDLLVPSARSSPHVVDLDHDGKKDLLTGNTNGQLILYTNAASDTAPAFSGHVAMMADTVVIDLAGTPRSRPFVCDWTGRGCVGVIIGASDGLIHLYQGTEHEDCSTGIAEGGPAPRPAAELLVAYPNPFAPRTAVPFIMSGGGHARLAVYDLAGREVTVLVDGWVDPGEHEVVWRGVGDRGRRLPAGVYFARLTVGKALGVQKLVLLR